MISQDKPEDAKTRRPPNDKRKWRGRKKKKTPSSENPLEGPRPQKASKVSTIEPDSSNIQASGTPKTPVEASANLFPKLNTESLPQPPKHQDQLMSPRKQTLLRHKKSSDQVSEPSFISEAKQIRKNRKQPAPTNLNEASSVDDEHKYLGLLSQQNLQGKSSLFRYQAARILVYHEQIHDPVLQSSSGTLLGHGEIEIFQLHNGDVTYLLCGRSFVYPLLPKLKILRISLNQFILPLSNPERYWKINLDTEDVAVIKDLEQILQSVVKYTNLSFAAANAPSLLSYQEEGIQEPRTPVKAKQQDVDGEDLHAGREITPKSSHFKPFFNDIPESPPSAPVSPQQLYEPEPAFQLPPNLLQSKGTDQGITAALASFNLNEHNSEKPNPKLFQPKPVSLAHPHSNPHANPLASIPAAKELSYKLQSNPYQSRTRLTKADAKSDTSSMDSLLDEYEENISTTKSINYNIPRSQSRTMSLASSAYPAAINYQRGKIPLVPDIRSNVGSTTHEAADEEAEDEFPKTSLSQYNRARQNTQSQRSRRSSPSELYNSVSNWMEPSVRQPQPQPQPQLSHSRSNYSLASAKNSIASNRTQEGTLRDIYRSITEKNLHANLQQPNGRRQSIGSGRGVYGPRPKANLLNPHPKPPRSELKQRMNGKSELLSSSDVYRLVSARRSESGQPSKQGGLSRLFGW